MSLCIWYVDDSNQYDLKIVDRDRIVISRENVNYGCQCFYENEKKNKKRKYFRNVIPD